MKLPPEQEAMRARCFHPSGKFVEFPKEDLDKSIPERFEEIVFRFPDRVALRTKECQLTYEELNRRANRLAHYILARRGAAPEPVGLFLDHWDDLLIAHLAVLKTGKFSLALDSTADVTRTSHLLVDSGAQIIILDEYTEKSARELVTGKSVVIMNDLELPSSNNNPKVQISPESCAYIRYTSGSTGSAKGVTKTHRHVLKSVMDFANHFHLCLEDRVTLFGLASIGKHLFIALLTGASLCPFDARKEGLLHLAEWLLREQTTVYYSFPTAFRHFVSSLSSTESFPDLRLIELEGEPLYWRDVESLRKHFSPHCLMVNTLSSAETGTVCLYFLDRNISVSDGPVPVGYSVDDVNVLVLDDAGKPVDCGQIGEVAVCSRFLSNGYWRKPDVISRTFIPQTESGSDFVYLTGDLGRISQDGCLQLLGRRDFQVKVRSFRVDVSEVEGALSNHPALKSVVVMGKNDQYGTTKLVAYVVPKNHPGPGTPSLRRFLEQNLPEYMIPSVFVFLDELPLMSTGKVNRRALPEPGRRRPDLGTPIIAPRTPTEKEIARIWAEVLSLDEVGVSDRFLDLGGNSLAASRIISQIVRSFQLELPVNALFDSPTVAEMAPLITRNQGNKASSEEFERLLHEVEAMSEEEAERRVKKTISKISKK